MIEIKTFQSGSSGNLHMIQDGDSKIILECGLSIKKIKEYLSFNLDIDFCLLTHCHMDHAKSAQAIMDLGVELFCSQETADKLGLHGHRLSVISGRIERNGWTVIPYLSQHDTPGSLLFVIEKEKEKVLFATDTFSIPYPLTGFTHIMIECNHSSETFTRLNRTVDLRIINTHMSLNKCLSFLKSTDLSRTLEIHLIHLSSRNSDAEYFKSEVQKLTGKVVIIG